MKPTLRPVEDNPFYGKTALLSLYNNGNRASTAIALHDLLNKAHTEANTPELKALLIMLIFNIGDIGGRNPQYLRGKATHGGHGARFQFIWALMWVLSKSDIKRIFPFEYVAEHSYFEALWYNQIRTDRKKGRVLSSTSVLTTEESIQFIASVVAEMIKRPGSHHTLIAKYLTVPKFSTRKGEKGRRTLQPVTVDRVKKDFQFALALSEKVGWLVEKKPQYTKFTGLIEFKKANLQNTEAHLFSSKKILSFGKAQFLQWLDTLPAGARYRVEKRLERYPQKWGELPSYYTQWVEEKKQAQQALKEFKATNQGDLTIAEQNQLKELKKAAKVTTGGTNFKDLFLALSNKENSIELALEALLEKVEMKVPVLPVVDVSGSMYSNHTELRQTSAELAALCATITLLKNPHENKGDFLMHFSSTGGVIDSRSPEQKRANRFIVGNSIPSNKLIVPTDSFIDNYKRVYQKLDSVYHGGTNISAIFEAFRTYVNSAMNKQAAIESLNEYPVLLVLSDGDLNSCYSPAASMAKFQMEMRQAFGWEGVIVIWDTVQKEKSNNFEGLENVIYFSGTNPDVLTQIFSKIHDLDIIDVYTGLKSLFASERYEKVKAFALAKTSNKAKVNG